MLWTHNLFFSASSCGGLLIFASVINKLSNEFYFTVCSSFFSPFFGVFLIIFWSYFFPFNFYSLNVLVNGSNIVLNVALMSLCTLHIHFNSFLMFWALIILVGCLSLFSFAFFFFLAGEINRGAKVSTLLQLMKNQHKYFHCFATLYEFGVLITSVFWVLLFLFISTAWIYWFSKYSSKSYLLSSWL